MADMIFCHIENQIHPYNMQHAFEKIIPIEGGGGFLTDAIGFLAVLQIVIFFDPVWHLAIESSFRRRCATPSGATGLFKETGGEVEGNQR